MTGAHRPVFVYGTLTDPERVDAVLDEWAFDGDAVLEGCQRVEGEYPTLAPGGRVAGRLLVTPSLDALDEYEGVASGLYVRASVPVADAGEWLEVEKRRGAERTRGGEAWLYVGDPARLDAPARWPGDGPFVSRVRAYLDTSAVVVRQRNDANQWSGDR